MNVKQVKRGMKAADARKLCPELSLVQVPTRHGKADISLYRCARSYSLLYRADSFTTWIVSYQYSGCAFHRLPGTCEVPSERSREARKKRPHTGPPNATGLPAIVIPPTSAKPSSHPPLPPCLLYVSRNPRAPIAPLFNKQRHAGEKVVSVLERAGGPTTAVEKASIDEVYVDVTSAAQALLSSLKHGDGTQAKLADQQQQHEGTAGKENEKEEGGADEKGIEAMSAPSGEERGREPRRWEDIGAGGWVAVVLEAASTHVSGLVLVFACCSAPLCAFSFNPTLRPRLPPS